jgi:hypothetical protein
MDRGNQSNFVPSDIKHSEFPNLIGLWENFAQLCEIHKPLFSRNRVPTRESRFRFRVFLREFIQSFPSNDVHYGRQQYAKRLPVRRQEAA